VTAGFDGDRHLLTVAPGPTSRSLRNPAEQVRYAATIL
jgi:hypothetical protein